MPRIPVSYSLPKTNAKVLALLELRKQLIHQQLAADLAARHPGLLTEAETAALRADLEGRRATSQWLAELVAFAKGVGFDVLMVVGFSMLICTVLGGVIGALLPFLARRIGTDPATLSSPLITSIMDLLGVFIYFGFAYAFLGDLLTQAAG